jgi:hypothetical protein
MLYFVRTEYLLDGWLATHTVREFADPAAAIDYATARTEDGVVSVRLYTSEEAA